MAQTRYLPVSLTNSVCPSCDSAMPLAKLRPRATTRVLPVAGSCSMTRPVAACSRMSSTLASKVPPHCAGAKRVEASVR